MGIARRAYERYAKVGATRFIRESVQFVLAPPLTGLCNCKFHLRHGTGIDVFDEDWDTLVLLDACRYDVFAEENTLDGSLASRIAQGRMSWEFMEANFVGRELHDTVYVTANPYVVNLDDGIFHAIVDDPLTEHWDEEVETVRPENVTDVAIDVHKRYPKKRLIVHYMQPHTPYIGETGRKIDQQFSTKGFDRYRSIEVDERDDDRTSRTVWEGIRGGTLDVDEVKEAYRENLDIVIESTERLLSSVDGLSVVSSDHGEMFGERPCGVLPKGYGHGKMA